MKHYRLTTAALAVLALTACATAPLAPRVAVMPAPGKSLDIFAAEDRECRQFAEISVGPNAANASADRFAGAAALGTVIGAAAGAAVGGRDSAGAGAAFGLLAGTASGSRDSAVATYDIQRRYDIAYQQCMYTKGNQLPGYAPRQVAPLPPAAIVPPQPVPTAPAYPPANQPPPPPPPGR